MTVTPSDNAAVRLGSRIVEVAGRRLVLSGLEQPLWASDGIARGDVLDYYLDVAGEILPFLVNRPFSVLRCAGPDVRESLFQKTALPGLPPWIPTRRLPGDTTPPEIAEYMVGGDTAGLAHLVNLGCLSFHPWSCTVDSLEHPDQMIFDLDANEIAFREVRNAALLLRDLLGRYRIQSWVKTTGGSGLHVMIPLRPVYSYDEVRTAAEIIACLARAREPTLFSFDMRRARRRGRILIDVQRNRRAATVICPFGVRPDSPCVAMPLEWPELERPVYPEEFHIKNARERLERVGNPARSFFGEPQSLMPLLRSGGARPPRWHKRRIRVERPAWRAGEGETA